jgi:hypothetical protein
MDGSVRVELRPQQNGANRFKGTRRFVCVLQSLCFEVLVSITQSLEDMNGLKERLKSS